MLRRTALCVGLVALAGLAAGCVEEQPVYRPHPPPPRVVYAPAPPPVVEIIAPMPPPPRIVEPPPPPRPGWVWARAYWRWNGSRYVVRRGHWIPARPGYHYVHPHWERRNDGWHLHVGVWVSN